MKYQILQLDADRERFRDLAFRHLAEGQRVDFAEYVEVYTGEISTGDNPWATLELLFRQFNIDHPADFEGRSMSVSDIVELDGKRTFYCQNTGWEELSPDRIDNRHSACSECGFRTDRLIGHPDGRELCQSCDGDVA